MTPGEAATVLAQLRDRYDGAQATANQGSARVVVVRGAEREALAVAVDVFSTAQEAVNQQ